MWPGISWSGKSLRLTNNSTIRRTGHKKDDEVDMAKLKEKITKIFKARVEKGIDVLSNGDVSKTRMWLRAYAVDIIVAALLALVLAFLFPKGKSFQFADLKEGRVYIGPEIIAPFTFAVNKSQEEYNLDVAKAKANVAPVFSRDPHLSEEQLANFDSYIDQLVTLLEERDLKGERVKELCRNYSILLSDEDIALILNGFANDKTNGTQRTLPRQKIIDLRQKEVRELAQVTQEMIREIYSVGILNVSKSSVKTTTQKKISTRSDGTEMLEDLNFYFDASEAFNSLLERLRSKTELDEKRIKLGYQIGTSFLRPNVIYDEAETNLRISQAEANVPLVKDQVLAGERIIDNHSRITRQHIEKLNSLAVAKAERGESSNFWRRSAPAVGKYFTALFILGILAIYLWRERRYVLNDRKRLFLIELVIFIVAVTTFIVNQLAISAYLIPVSIGAMIVTIFFDTYVGFLVTICTSLLVGAMRGNEFGITLVSAFVSSVALLTVSKVRTRNWVTHSMMAIAAANIVAITILDFLNYVPFKDLFQDAGFGAINGFMVPIFTYVLIIIFESVFDLTTDMTLLELSDLNQPLLRELAMQAPGSYHHSIIVGNLAESATEAIGGNALLARVGAYYHDIGKMEKPEYFVENQTRGHNPQEKLTPSMSSLILLNHVRKGAEISRKHKLPKEIEAFIFQHHGTGLMSYFYQKALEQSDGQNVSENEFRYPGPRPNTQETAIVMLADAVEAASRTLKDPSPSRIKGIVEQLIDERFKSGELDDSPLTLKDLSKISESFQKILIGMFHGRVEYPGFAGKEKHKEGEKERTAEKRSKLSENRKSD
jgi:putative nucleotidyltransferase with HDIG domain